MPEQQAFDGGLMDKFVEFTGVGAPGCPDYRLGTALTMGYYDGNTVTAMVAVTCFLSWDVRKPSRRGRSKDPNLALSQISFHSS